MKKYNGVKLQITRMYKLNEDSNPTKAFFDIAIAEAFIVKGYRIVEVDGKLLVSAPREEGRDGKWFYVVIPLTREVKDEIERLALEMYGS